MEEHKLIKDYTLANITLMAGGMVRVEKAKVKPLQEAGYIAKPRKKKESAKAEA